MADKLISVLGSFVADLAFRTKKIPAWGETVLGSGFVLGPGGKGSNQAVAARRLVHRVSFISKLGRDPFGDLARRMYEREGIDAQFVVDAPDLATGGAAIIVDEARGENAIIVAPGASYEITPAEIDLAPVLSNLPFFLRNSSSDSRLSNMVCASPANSASQPSSIRRPRSFCPKVSSRSATISRQTNLKPPRSRVCLSQTSRKANGPPKH